MKKKISKAILFVLTAGMLVSFSGCGQSSLPNEELSRLVADAVISENTDMYMEGECCGEGHMLLGSSLSGNRLEVYALTVFGCYGFQNDMFIKVSGSGVIPTVLTFEKDGTDYRLLEIKYPQDGANYSESIKQMFPMKYRAQVLTVSEAQRSALSAQERSYAEAYLKSIGREAEVGEYRDLDMVPLTELGVSVEISNELIMDSRLSLYPYWIGTSEFLENGKRYIRSLSLDEAAGEIIYRTVEAETGRTTEIFVFDAVTGEEAAFPAE